MMFDRAAGAHSSVITVKTADVRVRERFLLNLIRESSFM
jgi:hypothetical protein